MASVSVHVTKSVTHSVNKVDDLEDPLSDFVDITVRLLVLRSHKSAIWLVTGRECQHCNELELTEFSDHEYVLASFEVNTVRTLIKKQ